MGSHMSSHMGSHMVPYSAWLLLSHLQGVEDFRQLEASNLTQVEQSRVCRLAPKWRNCWWHSMASLWLPHGFPTTSQHISAPVSQDPHQCNSSKTKRPASLVEKLCNCHVPAFQDIRQSAMGVSTSHKATRSEEKWRKVKKLEEHCIFCDSSCRFSLQTSLLNASERQQFQSGNPCLQRNDNWIWAKQR